MEGDEKKVNFELFVTSQSTDAAFCEDYFKDMIFRFSHHLHLLFLLLLWFSLKFSFISVSLSFSFLPPPSHLPVPL